MNNYTNSSIFKKVRNILLKKFDDRQDEEVHYLSLAFKKKIIQIDEVHDWQTMSDCLKSLILVNTNETCIKSSQIAWIYVIDGHFEYYEMNYKQNQFLTLLQNSEKITFFGNSYYAVLTWSALELARKKREHRLKEEYKMKTRQFLFASQNIRQKTYNTFWNHVKIQTLKKKQKLELNGRIDTIFLVIEGGFFVQYKWKRRLNIRQAGEGSIFSTNLERYFYKTQKQYKAKKSQKQYSFDYICSENTVCISFSADLFFQHNNLKFYKYIIDKAWQAYKERVQIVNEIIQKVGLMRNQKSEIKKMIKIEKESEKLSSKTLSYGEKGFKKITDLSFLTKTNRRKVPNLASKSEESKTKNNFFHAKVAIQNKERCRSELVLNKTTIQTSRKDTKPLFTEQMATRSTIDMIHGGLPKTERVTQFFKPSEFLSKKLKIQYETILDKLDDFEVMNKSSEKNKKFKTEKEYYEAYINERRIMKLGPKKRIIYKKRLEF